MGLWEEIGEGFRGMGAVASPQVAQQQAEERANTLPNVIRGLQIASASRALQADQDFQKAIQGKITPGMNSSAMLDAVSGIDPAVMSVSPAAQTYLKQVGQVQQREALAQQRLQTLEIQRQRIEFEKERLERAAGRAPATRTRISGTNEVQEEWNPTTRKWDEIGRGPRSSTQVNVSTSNPLGNDPAFWYEYYDKTGKLPPMAWGSAGNPTREQFLKGFPEWKKTHGGGGASGTAASQASFKADAGALNAVTKDLNTFEPYKKMLDTNADIAIQLGRKIYMSDAQLSNKPINWLRQNAMSNPDVSEYLAQMRFVQTEAARVINNPRIVGQLTDEARKEMDQVISGNAPMPVVERVLNRLKADGNNRFNAMRSQQAGIIEKMKGNEPSSSTPQPARTGPKEGDKSTSKSGKPIHWDGKQWVYD